MTKSRRERTCFDSAKLLQIFQFQARKIKIIDKKSKKKWLNFKKENFKNCEKEEKICGNLSESPKILCLQNDKIPVNEVTFIG